MSRAAIETRGLTKEFGDFMAVNGSTARLRIWRSPGKSTRGDEHH